MHALVNRRSCSVREKEKILAGSAAQSFGGKSSDLQQLLLSNCHFYFILIIIFGFYMFQIQFCLMDETTDYKLHGKMKGATGTVTCMKMHSTQNILGAVSLDRCLRYVEKTNSKMRKVLVGIQRA